LHIVPSTAFSEPELTGKAADVSQYAKEIRGDVDCKMPVESTTLSSRPQSDDPGHDRVRLLEESAKRLREKAERLRAENRRSRVFGTSGVVSVSPEPVQEEAPKASASKHQEEIWRKIAVLDEINKAERQKLAEEQQEMEERRRAQEAFEKSLQEQVDRDLQEHREKEAREAKEQAAKEDEARQAQEARAQRRMEQLAAEADRSKQLEEQRKLGRSEEMQSRWQQLEEELEKQWAEQEAEERRRVDDYARDRRRQFEDWERSLAAERQRFASLAEFSSAARHHKARSAAYADEQFYGHRAEKAPGYAAPAEPEHKSSGNLSRSSLNADEHALLKELQSVQNCSREAQKAKVKELLLRWHPDKNLENQEKAKQLFQFVQQQRRLVLGL